MSEDGKSVKVTDSLMEVYGSLDKHLEGLLQTKFKASCTKGCSHCCHLLATITFAEGLLLAETILGKENWKEWVPKIRAAAVRTDYLGISRTNYFHKGHPCVFLGEDKLCQVYEVRPACCRYHVVGSPPENCSFLAPPSTKTMALDLIAMEEHVWGLSMAVVTQLNQQGMMIGPLALMVLACMEFITANATEDQDIADHAIITEACRGLRSPKQWMMECGRSLVEEEDRKPPVRIPIGDIK